MKANKNACSYGFGGNAWSEFVFFFGHWFEFVEISHRKSYLKTQMYTESLQLDYGVELLVSGDGRYKKSFIERLSVIHI